MTDSILINKCEEKLIPYFKKVEEIALFNQEKVLNVSSYFISLNIYILF